MLPDYASSESRTHENSEGTITFQPKMTGLQNMQSKSQAIGSVHHGDESSRSAECCPCCGKSGAAKLLQAPDRYHGRQEMYQLVRCPACALVWLQNPPPPGEMSQHYGPDYDRSIAAAGADPNRG